MTRSPFAINVREAPTYVVPVKELVTVLARAEETGGAFGLMEGLLTRGADPPPHVHHREDESFFILEGTLGVRVGDDSFTAVPGSFVFCPRDTPHLLTVESDEVRLLTFITPGGLEPFSSNWVSPHTTEPSQRSHLSLMSSGSSHWPGTMGSRCSPTGPDRRGAYALAARPVRLLH